MHESILSRMMRISKGTYYSGSWSSTACIFQISLHPCLELNPSSLGAGWPTHQPRASGITVYLAWLGLFIDFTHKLTINPLSLYKRLKERMWGGGGGDPKPLFYRRKDQPITFLLHAPLIFTAIRARSRSLTPPSPPCSPAWPCT